MQKKVRVKRLADFHAEFYVSALIMVSVLGLVLAARSSNAQTNTQIVIDPSFAAISIGDVVTITINATNIPELFGWQVALKYNGTVVNCTEVEIPSSIDVFSKRRQEDQFKPIDVGPNFGNDTHDRNQWLLIGSQCITGPVAVTNGILFRANFTALENGDTTILIATKTDPVYFSEVDWDRYYTFMIDTSSNELPFASSSITVTSGGGNAKPVAKLTGVGPEVDNSTNYVLYGNRPVGDVQFIQTFKDYAVYFNASESYDANENGSVTSYVWNFGDENITTTSVPYVIHAFSRTGVFDVRLTVVDNGEPPLESEPASRIVVVGLVLQYADWSPLWYAVIAIIVVVVAFSVAKRIQTQMRKPSLQIKDG